MAGIHTCTQVLYNFSASASLVCCHNVKWKDSLFIIWSGVEWGEGGLIASVRCTLSFVVNSHGTEQTCCKWDTPILGGIVRSVLHISVYVQFVLWDFKNILNTGSKKSQRSQHLIDLLTASRVNTICSDVQFPCGVLSLPWSNVYNWRYWCGFKLAMTGFNLHHWFISWAQNWILADF